MMFILTKILFVLLILNICNENRMFTAGAKALKKYRYICYLDPVTLTDKNYKFELHMETDPTLKVSIFRTTHTDAPNGYFKMPAIIKAAIKESRAFIQNESKVLKKLNEKYKFDISFPTLYAWIEVGYLTDRIVKTNQILPLARKKNDGDTLCSAVVHNALRTDLEDTLDRHRLRNQAKLLDIFINLIEVNEKLISCGVYHNALEKKKIGLTQKRKVCVMGYELATIFETKNQNDSHAGPSNDGSSHAESFKAISSHAGPSNSGSSHAESSHAGTSHDGSLRSSIEAVHEETPLITRNTDIPEPHDPIYVRYTKVNKQNQYMDAPLGAYQYMEPEALTSGYRGSFTSWISVYWIGCDIITALPWNKQRFEELFEENTFESVYNATQDCLDLMTDTYACEKLFTDYYEKSSEYLPSYGQIIQLMPDCINANNFTSIKMAGEAMIAHLIDTRAGIVID